MRTRLSSLTAPALLAAILASGCESSGAMEVTGINPRTGHIAGEQTVEITGKHFRTDIGYSVYFGNAKAKAVSIRGPESLGVSTPSGAVGTVDVTVRADDGNSFLLKQAFKYEDMGGSVVDGLGK